MTYMLLRRMCLLFMLSTSKVSLCRHVEKSLTALRKSVASQEDMDEDDLEELVRASLLHPLAYY